MQKSKTPCSLVTPEEGRHDRQHNNAVTILAISEQKDAPETIPTKTVRLYVRSELGLPTLTGEKLHGDFRAHGDAIGGHGLGLETRSFGGKKHILLNADNLAKCEAYLASEAPAQPELPMDTAPDSSLPSLGLTVEAKGETEKKDKSEDFLIPPSKGRSKSLYLIWYEEDLGQLVTNLIWGLRPGRGGNWDKYTDRSMSDIDRIGAIEKGKIAELARVNQRRDWTKDAASFCIQMRRVVRILNPGQGYRAYVSAYLNELAELLTPTIDGPHGPQVKEDVAKIVRSYMTRATNELADWKVWVTKPFEKRR